MATTELGAASQRSVLASPALHLALIVLWSMMLFAFVSVGHIASDDQLYIGAARDWLEITGYAPDNHWAVRHTVTLPIAISFALFGDGEWQSVLPSTLYALALASTVYLILNRYLGAWPAILGSVALVTTGLYSELGTIANADVTETLLLLLGLFLFYEGARHDGDVRRLSGAGLLLGLAFLTRETAAAVPVTLAALFVLGAYTERWRYFIVGGAFLVPVLVEAAYYTVIGEGPLHRFETVLTSAGTPRATVEGAVDAGTGNITNNRLLAPFAAMLANNEFMLVFWMGIAAGLSLWWKGTLRRGSEFGFVRLVLLAAVIWIPFQFYFLGLRPLPRYLAFPLVAAVFLIGPWLAHLLTSGRQTIAALLLAALVGTNLFAIDMSNKAPRHPERLLARWALEYDEPIYADAEFIGRAGNFLIWAGVDGEVRPAPPPPGSLYAARLVTRRGNGLTATTPAIENAQVAARWDGESTITGTIIGHLGLRELVSQSPFARLLRYGEPVRLYRLPSS